MFCIMKKKFLLAVLFSVTAVLAAVGLATEKTMAQGGLDDPFWMETGGGTGQERPERVRCMRTVVHNETATYIFADPGTHSYYSNPQEEIWYGTAIFCDGQYVLLTSCNPSNPCY